jgi:hypothetical protein
MPSARRTGMNLGIELDDNYVRVTYKQIRDWLNNPNTKKDLVYRAVEQLFDVMKGKLKDDMDAGHMEGFEL